MLTRLKVRDFKSLANVDVRLPRLVVLFGPNAAGKSNLLDAIQALSRSSGSRTLAEALAEPIRGYPAESFSFPPGGLPELLEQSQAGFSLEAEVSVGKDTFHPSTFHYRLAIQIDPGSGALSVADEYLAALNKQGQPKGVPAIEVVEGGLRLRRKGRGKPRFESLGQNFSMLSDPRLIRPEYSPIARVRSELSTWTTYYLDPRVAMRSAKPPAEVRDIGVLGEQIGPFLYHLRTARPKAFDAVRRTLGSLIPSVAALEVDLDKRRGTLDIMIQQDGTLFSSRIISEGTLRVLALCAIAVNPWNGSLIAFEEPENGVHPRRLELIAQLLFSLATEQDKQVIVTTHSPLFCDAVLRLARSCPQDVALLNVGRSRKTTSVSAFDAPGPLFEDSELARGLTSAGEDGIFAGLMLRGFLDE